MNISKHTFLLYLQPNAFIILVQVCFVLPDRHLLAGVISWAWRYICSHVVGPLLDVWLGIRTVFVGDLLKLDMPGWDYCRNPMMVEVTFWEDKLIKWFGV